MPVSKGVRITSREPLCRREVAFILVVPVAWGILLLFTPAGRARRSTGTFTTR